ncbi:MAG: phosphohistidine phosphatase SixA [Thermoprotei archaeon]
MVIVCLVQHGEALPEEVDPNRPLSERGRRETEKIARFLASIGFKPDKIIHSTKLRARQTAEILAQYLKPDKGAEEVEGLEPKADPRIWAEKLDNTGENTIVVGHLPHLSRLASLLLTGSEEKEIIRFRYSGIYCLEKTENNWRIIWALTPDIIP